MLSMLIPGEAIEVMKDLIKRGVKVDAIICDPPYGVTSNQKDIPLNNDELFEVLEKFNCPVILFGQDTSKNLFASKLKILSMESKLKYKYSIYWDKQLKSNFLNAKKSPLRQVEEIMIFGKGKITYNPQMVKGKPNHSKGTKHLEGNAKNQNYNNFKSIETAQSNLKYPSDLISIQKPHPSKAVHATQKPLELMEYLVRTYSNEGDIVLDFTMGSGTTGLACKNLNRDFIGIELDEKYFNIAEQRIKEVK